MLTKVIDHRYLRQGLFHSPQEKTKMALKCRYMVTGHQKTAEWLLYMVTVYGQSESLHQCLSIVYLSPARIPLGTRLVAQWKVRLISQLHVRMQFFLVFRTLKCTWSLVLI